MTHTDQIEVTVPFAAGPANRGTFHRAYEAATTADTVVQDALEHYGVSPDDGTRYYLMHGDTVVEGGTTLAALVGHGKALRLPLRTATVSG